MARWHPPVGTTTLIEPVHPEPGCESITAVVLDDDRFLVDLGASPRPRTSSFDAVASFFTQGRAYVVQRPVSAPKTPLMAYSREYLMRGDHRIVALRMCQQHEEHLVGSGSIEIVRQFQGQAGPAAGGRGRSRAHRAAP